MKKIVWLILFLVPYISNAQDFNCRVQVIYPQIQVANTQRFKNLENSIREFINTRKWSDDKIQSNERIEWSLIINVTEFDNASSSFKATAQIQSSRPVFNTGYNSVLINYEDVHWQFEYIDFQPMDFSVGNYNTNLTSLVGYYIYIVLGLDADSFKLEGGSEYLSKANSVMLAAQQRGIPGWQTTDGGNKNRYWLIENLLNDRFKPVREAYYRYHIKGLDVMSKDIEEARLEITASLQLLQKVWKVMPNSMLLKVWFNAKVEEIVNIYCKALTTDKNKVIAILKEADPANSNKYDAIRTCN
jgi:hypothetical protein